MSMAQILEKMYMDGKPMPDLIHPDFVLHSPGSSPVAGEFRGLEAMQGHLAHMQQLSNNSFRMNVQNTFLADDEWGMVVHRMTAEREGKHLDSWGFGIWRFADEKFVDHWEGIGDQAHWDDFWS